MQSQSFLDVLLREVSSPPLKKKKKKAFEQGIGKTSLW